MSDTGRARTDIGRRSTLLGAAAIGIAAFLRPEPTRARDQVGVVTEVRGVASAEAVGETRGLTANGPVYLEELLRTGDQSRLGLRLGVRTSVRVGARSKLRIDQYIVDAGGEIVVDNGQILFDGPADGFPKGLNVRSPYALIGVRGTWFFAGELDGGYSVFVVSGRVSVSAGGSDVTLGTREGTDIWRVGEPPGPAKRWGSRKIARAMLLVN